MKLELIGSIAELLTDSTGIILGEDENYYLFSKVDFLDDCDLEIGMQVIFKPIMKDIADEKINKAILIEKKETS